MDFNWIEYLDKLFENNNGLDPHKLWEIAKSELSDEEKAVAFNQGAAKGDLSNRRHQWANSKASFCTPPVFTSPGVTKVKQTTFKSSLPHAGGAVYDEYGELDIVRNTHNEARKNKWLSLGDWTEADWLAVEKYNYAMSDTYKANAKWAHGAATVLKDNGGTTRDNWNAMLDKLGPCPVVS